MSKRDELIRKYADDLNGKCGVKPDLDLLTKVTVGCGPSIYNADASTVSSTDPQELATVRKNFLVKKLGLSDGPALDAGIAQVVDTYGKSNPRKYRAVIYYLLTKHFQREGAYA